MRIVISDFDGTLTEFLKPVRPHVVQAIRRWRERGNAFGIATGRDRFMLLPEIERSGIPFDFLVLVNGAALYDGRQNLLQAVAIDDELVPAILRHPAAMASEHYQLISPDAIFFMGRDDTFFSHLGIPYVPVDFETALGLKNLFQISFWYPTARESSEAAARLAADFAGRIDPHANLQAIDINRQGVDKATGIERILPLLGWEGADVHTIGDATNDLCMVKRYHGATVPGGVAELKAAAEKVYPDVAAMLEDLGI